MTKTMFLNCFGKAMQTAGKPVGNVKFVLQFADGEQHTGTGVIVEENNELISFPAPMGQQTRSFSDLTELKLAQ